MIQVHITHNLIFRQTIVFKMPTKTELTIAVPKPTAPLFIYTPQSLALSDIKPPPSPTSSLKACFVRSRPTSADFSEFECSFNDFSGLGNGDSDRVAWSTSSGTTSPPSSTPTSACPCHCSDDFMDRVTLATEHWARMQLLEKDEDRPLRSANSDARSLALSTITATSRHTVVPLRVVRRSHADVDEELAKVARGAPVFGMEKEEDKSKSAEVKGKDDTKRRRTWPSYKAIRRTVSHIVHRKDPPAPPPTSIVKPIVGPIDKQQERIKPSSTSLFSRRRRPGPHSDNSNKLSTNRTSFLQRALSTSSRPSTISAIQHRAQLRRSRSFSGFTNVLSAIVDAEQEQDEDLDEVTAEARNVVTDIGRTWAFENVIKDVDDEHAGFLFERCVE